VGHFSPPLYEWAEKIVFSPCGAFISHSEAFSAGGHWLKAMTIERSFMGECYQSHECVKDGYKSIYVKFGGYNVR